MGWIEKLRNIFKPAKAEALELFVRCNHCKAVCKVRVDVLRDLESIYQDEGPAYVLNKEAMDASCFRIMTIHMEFDRDRAVLERSVTGGAFVTQEDYDGQQSGHRA